MMNNDAGEIAVATDQSTGHDQGSLGQRVYDLITAMDAVDTDSHLNGLAWALQCFGADILDVASLVQDAPRLKAMIKRFEPDDWFVKKFGNPRTTFRQIAEGVELLDAYVDMHLGMLREISQLLKQLVESLGIESESDLFSRRRERSLPLTPSFARRPGSLHSAVYVWTFPVASEQPLLTEIAPTAILESDSVRQSIQTGDEALVANCVRTCLAKEAPLKQIADLIVCVAGSLDEAHHLVCQARTTNISELLQVVDPRVCLLDQVEQPRVVINWSCWLR